MKFRQIQKHELHEVAILDANTNRSPWSLFNYEQSAKNPQHHLLGIFDNDDLILGVCVYGQILDEAEILQLFVRYEKQQNGYAYELLNQILNELQTQNVTQIFLEVMVGNTKAINLYHKLSFNIINTRKNYYCVAGKYIDALVMAKQL